MRAEEQNARPAWVDFTILSLAFVIFLGFLALGTWQLYRLDWKLGLIEAVEARAYGEPVIAPSGPVTREDHAYLRVELTGEYLHESSRLVKAVTELGTGFWLLTPLDTGRDLVWINRGYVPPEMTSSNWTHPEGEQIVTGLLRITEPNGTILEKNDPLMGRWYSRDVEALSEIAGLTNARGYFIDADDASEWGSFPRGGLTVVSFRNNHLSYAITWYAMAALFAAGMGYVIWDRIRSKRWSERRREGARRQPQGRRSTS